jgi:polyhydroxyalkanoate synthesis regulator phasin
MEFFEIIKKSLLAGIGVPEKLREVIDELVQKGELSESQGAKLIKEWTEKVEHGASDMGKALNESVDRALQRFNCATRKDVEELKAEIKDIKARLFDMEGAGGKEREG